MPRGIRRLQALAVALAAFGACRAPAQSFCAATWNTPHPAGDAPAARWIPGMAYDAARSRTVVFGGSSQSGGGVYVTYYDDTWLWDGIEWTPVSLPEHPEGRESPALAYDEGRAVTVLFGGKDTELVTGNHYHLDTWEWDGTSWARRAVPGPGGRGRHAMAYDAARQRIVLFGGDRDHAFLGDTWEWDGSSWSLRSNTGPSPRAGAAMGYDRARQRVVLFGGSAADGVKNDVWEWDGSGWGRRTLLAPLPVPRSDARLAWDDARRALVLYGGSGTTGDVDAGVWELSEGWASRESSGAARRDGHGMAWDADRRRLVVFGGVFYNGQTASFLGDVVERRAPIVTERLVPVVVDVVGLGAAHFTTELSLTNRTNAPADFELAYTAALGSGSGSVFRSVGAGQQLVIPDVVANLRAGGLLIPTSGGQAGTLVVRFPCVDAADGVAVVARTGAPTGSPHPVGRAGLAYAGLPATPVSATSKRTVFGLRSNATDRSNVAVFNQSPFPVSLKVTAVSGDVSDARRVTIADPLDLGPFQWKQYAFGDTGLANGHVVVERPGGDASFDAYGVVNDNATNDGSFVASDTSSLSLTSLVVPVLVETTRFRSELLVANGGEGPATLDLTYVESLDPTPAVGTARISLRPFEQLVIPNAIDYLRRSGAPLGAAGAVNRAGALRVDVSPPGSPVYAGARTAAPSSGGGQFGLFTPGIEVADPGPDSGYLYGLRSDADNRSNVALVNFGRSTGQQIIFSIDVFDGDLGGRFVANRVEIVGPGKWLQVDNILGVYGVRNGWVRVTRGAGTAPWTAYGIVNDGGSPGARTGDGAYVPMVEVTK